MYSTLILSLLLAHLLADFPFQTTRLCEMKYADKPKVRESGLCQHAVIHTITAFFATIHYVWSPVLSVYLFIYMFLHYLIDKHKTRFGIHHFGAFLYDQLIHITVILFLALLLEKHLVPAPWLNPFLQWSGLAAVSGMDGTELLNRILVVSVLLVTGIWMTGVFIRLYIRRLKGSQMIGDSGAQDGGYLIGLLERLLVITAVATNNASWAGLILGIKSVARFQKFNDDAFVEYFLIGSFISIFVALLIGFIIHRHFTSLFI
jgi:hypothetical protein